eukprot:UN05194
MKTMNSQYDDIPTQNKENVKDNVKLISENKEMQPIAVTHLYTLNLTTPNKISIRNNAPEISEEENSESINYETDEISSEAILSLRPRIVSNPHIKMDMDISYPKKRKRKIT